MATILSPRRSILGRITDRGVLGYGSSFSPRFLPGMSAWYDVSDLSSVIYDGSNRVSLIADKSPWSRVNGLVLNASLSNYASFTPLAAIGTGNFSVSAKLFTAAIGAGQSIIGGLNTSFGLFIDSTGHLVASKVNISSATASTGTLAAFTEYVCTYTRSGTTGVYYLNGVAIGTVTDNQDYAAGIGSIGRIGSSGGIFAFGGFIKNARIYSVALDQSGVTADAAGTVQANCIFNADFTIQSKLAASFTESSVNAATVTINTTGATGARISGARDLYQGTAANQPIYLPHTGTNYGYLNRTNGNWFSTPDSAAISALTDFTIISAASALDWSPAATRFLGGQLVGTGNQRSWYFSLNTSGTLGLGLSFLGTATTVYASTVAPVVSDGTRLWVAVTRKSSDGSIKFYTAPYSSSTPPSFPAGWTQLGTTVAGTTGALFDSNAALGIGDVEAGVSGGSWDGIIERFNLLNGYDGAGSSVFDFNAANYSSGTTFLDAANGATITLNGGATIVTRSCIYWNGSTHYLKAAAFPLAQPETVYFAGSQVTWTASDSIFDGNGDTFMRLLQFSSSPNVTISSGGAGASNNAWAVGDRALLACVFNGASSSIAVNNGTPGTGDAGSTGAGGFTLGARGDDAFFANITANEIAIYNVAHTAAQQNAFWVYASRKWQIL